MKLLQFLVGLLLFIACFDSVKYILFQRNEGESKSVTGVGETWRTIFGSDSLISELGTLTHWLIGGGCITLIFLLKNALRRILPKPSDIAKKFLSETNITKSDLKKREYLDNKISNTTINTFIDDQSYDFPGQLSTSQLQVLLEEMKFSVDEKFDEIGSWIDSNEQESKIWIKRLERVETEITYIRHQIFILMSNHAKSVGPSLYVGDVPDSRDQAETLRDLSNILAQVKKQFKEDESKGKNIRENKKECFHLSHSDTKNQEVNEISDESSIVELKPYEAKQRQIIINELRGKQRLRSKLLELPEIKQYSSDEYSRDEIKSNQLCTKKNESPESDAENTISSLNREESYSTNQSDKDIYNTDQDCGNELQEKWEYKYQHEEATAEIPHVEREQKSKPKEISQENKMKSHSPQSNVKSISPSRINNAGDCGYITVDNINEDSNLSTNLIKPNSLPTHPESPNSITYQSIKETALRSASPKRTVRFAQDKREDTARSPLWSPKKDTFSTKQTEFKGVSDPKITINQGPNTKGYRETLSCPVVDDKRESRRAILERELNNLERRASPSPTRSRHGKKSNVRSKVADYIRGKKPL